MKTAVRIIQVIVGLLFIFSGLVKANDPIGLSYKMQEFFELWSAGFAPGTFVTTVFSALHSTSLGLSIAMITLEILAGVALLVGWQKKTILWLLLVLIIFFTFLTGYAFLSGKFTNCGCFGDCLPITPLTSFVKDIALLAMIVFLLAGQRHIKPVFSGKARTVILGVTLLLTLGLQWYVLSYLPIADCLPFKKGNYLPAQMKPPPGAVQDSFAIRFIYEKDGKQFEFAPENLPADFATYKFVDRKQTLVRKGNADAPIKGFTLTNGNKDDMTGTTINYADTVLAQPTALLLFALNFSDGNWVKDARMVIDDAVNTGIPVSIISANFEEAQKAFAGLDGQQVQFYNTDFTVVRTVARTNPTLLLLKNGTVEKKWSKNDLTNASAFITTQKD